MKKHYTVTLPLEMFFNEENFIKKTKYTIAPSRDGFGYEINDGRTVLSVHHTMKQAELEKDFLEFLDHIEVKRQPLSSVVASKVKKLYFSIIFMPIFVK